MGNYTSCCLVMSKSTAKFIDTNGKLRLLKTPITAAEIMLEEPGHLVCSADDIRSTQRLLPMGADQEIRSGKFYIMIAAYRANCKASVLDMELIESACDKRKVKRHRSKVLPAVTEEEAGEHDRGKVLLGDGTSHRGCHLRQWRPALEPISETI